VIGDPIPNVPNRYTGSLHGKEVPNAERDITIGSLFSGIQ
jgi:hypothetical protein